jgi:hypothetical protein
MARLASALDYACIGGWNLAMKFANSRDSLIAVAKSAFQLLASSGRQPQPDECEGVVVAHLLGSKAFSALMHAGKVPTDVIIRDMLATSVARILLDEDWYEISH